VFAILACAHDIKDHGTPEKHISICSESPRSRENNVPISSSMPRGVKWYLCPACCGTLLGPWACRGEGEWNGWWAREEWLYHRVRRAGASLGGLSAGS
jgi:hypothetical protein